MSVCMLTSASIRECVLCQRCAKNLLPQRFSLARTHTQERIALLALSPQRLAVLLRVLPVHQPINRQHIYFLQHVLAVAFSSILPYNRSEQVHFYKRKSPLRQRCCGTQGRPAPVSISYGWEKRSWELHTHTGKSEPKTPVLNMPVLVIKCTCCFFFLPVTAGIILLQLEPNIANYKEDVTALYEA